MPPSNPLPRIVPFIGIVSTLRPKCSVYSVGNFYAVNALPDGVGMFEMARNKGRRLPLGDQGMGWAFE